MRKASVALPTPDGPERSHACGNLPVLKESKNSSLYKLYNIGNGKPIQLLDFIESLEKVLDISAIKNMLPMQAGDVNQTYANTSRLEHDFEYKPQTNVKYGIQEFVSWYKSYYNK